MLLVVWWCFFFFKQKTAYELRISDWSSDVCSSDLSQDAAEPKPLTCARCKATFKGQRKCPACGYEAIPATAAIPTHEADLQEITRAAKKDNRAARSDEGRVGNECGSTCRSRGSPYD